MTEVAGNAVRTEVIERRRSTFFAVSATVMFLIVFAGFSRTFYFRQVTDVTDILGNRDLPPHIVSHGVILSLWMVTFLCQSWLGALGRLRLHRQIGAVEVRVALAVVVSTVVTTIALVPRFVESGLPAARLVGVFVGDFVALIFFATFVVLAVIWRRRAGTHKRLMFFATLSILGPALAGGNRPLGAFLLEYLPRPGQLVALALVLALFAYDYAADRRIHSVTRWGAASLVARISIASSLLQNESVYRAITSLA